MSIFQTIKENITLRQAAERYGLPVKLIEQLYKDGEIPAYMFRNILNEYADVVDLAQFTVIEKREEEAA